LLPTRGPLAEAFDSAIARLGGTSVAYAHHQRALLAPGDNRAAYIDNAVGAKKLKELRRQLRRLGEGGRVDAEMTPSNGLVQRPAHDVVDLPNRAPAQRPARLPRSTTARTELLTPLEAGVVSLKELGVELACELIPERRFDVEPD